MSSKASKGKYSIVKGREAENEVVAYLRSVGFTRAERRRLSNHDTGDVSGIESVVLDVKNRRHMDLAAGMDDLAKKAEHACEEHGEVLSAAMIFKRPRRPTGEWYVVMPLDWYAKLLHLAGVKAEAP